MDRRNVDSSLPSLIVPCSSCRKGRMAVVTVMPTPAADDLVDITHECNECGAQLVRTVMAEKRAG
jgi:hypothetical protein